MYALTSASTLILSFLFGIPMLIVLTRILLQGFRAPFYHPVSQSWFKLTNPFFMPLQKVVPVVRGWHVGGIVLLLLLGILHAYTLSIVFGASLGATGILVAGVGMALDFALMSLFWLILVYVIVSWVAADSRSPMKEFVGFIARPICAPFRRLIPPIGMLDLSSMVVLLCLQLARILASGPLIAWGFGLRA
ncbi:hypothetical protein C7S18_03845 [Ahniella affigens]|uniref:YggT family protein n=1 Tax=Ahniella affigens TaxID=2021234 RepID=A0A2P1PNH5_9GAMM|nr:YggT family protein [Ahniella affigens]AVP96375.1 hypothetical protein C7S18_03845 [Ahniella affigens]